MGCCLSLTAGRQRNRHRHDEHHQNRKKNQSLDKKSKTHVSKASMPPVQQHPPHEVVETVKEVVLSESPNITKTLPKPPPTTTTSSSHQNRDKTSRQTPPPPPPLPPPPPKPSNAQEIKENSRVEKRQKHVHQGEEDELVVTPEVSQVSEMYSVTDSYSTATTVTEIREDEATSKRTSYGNHNVKNRASSSPSTRRRVHREQTVSSKSSPAGRDGVSASKRVVSSPNRSNVGPPGGGGGRGASSSSASRQSPITRRGRGGGRRGGPNHSGKMTGRGGNRSRVVSGGDEEERNNDVSRRNEQQELQQQRERNDESLDNPLVSLECFIFL